MKPTRNTPQRALVLRLISQNHTHPTADEIYVLARAEDPKISRGTVYRNLNLLSALGKIRRLAMPEGADHFDCVMENHYHFLCRQCHQVTDAPLPYHHAFNEPLPGLPGYQTEGHLLVLVGICPACQH
ncbi:MAG: transcriptional repressor [Clostridiales bacterium]